MTEILYKESWKVEIMHNPSQSINCTALELLLLVFGVRSMLCPFFFAYSHMQHFFSQKGSLDSAIILGCGYSWYVCSIFFWKIIGPFLKTRAGLSSPFTQSKKKRNNRFNMTYCTMWERLNPVKKLDKNY